VHSKVNAWTQSLIIGGNRSGYIKIESGIARGSMLRPALFLFYMNDLLNGLSSTVICLQMTPHYILLPCRRMMLPHFRLALIWWQNANQSVLCSSALWNVACYPCLGVTQSSTSISLTVMSTNTQHQSSI